MWLQLKRFFVETKNRIEAHHLELISGGVAFYAFLAIFPAIATCISLYGLLADASTVESNIEAIAIFLPVEVKDLVFARMAHVATNQDSSLTLGLLVGIVLSLWSANRAMKAIAKGLNITYEKQENRGFIKFNLVTLTLTLISSMVVIVVFAITVILPMLVSYFLSQESAKIITVILSWLILIGVILSLFVVLYRYAPSRDERPKIRDSLPGALFATILVLLGSIAFSFYVSNFGKYDEEYGAIATVVVTLLWLYLSSFIFLFGAEFNGESRNVTGDSEPQEKNHSPLRPR